MSSLDNRIKLAELCNVTVKESTLADLKGVLLCGSGFHNVWNPYKDDSQAFKVMCCTPVALTTDTDGIIVNNVSYDVEAFSSPAEALRFAICEEAIKNL